TGLRALRLPNLVRSRHHASICEIASLCVHHASICEIASFCAHHASICETISASEFGAGTIFGSVGFSQFTGAVATAGAVARGAPAACPATEAEHSATRQNGINARIIVIASQLSMSDRS